MDNTSKYIKYIKNKYIKYKQKYINIKNIQCGKNIKTNELEKDNQYIKCCYGYYSIDW